MIRVVIDSSRCQGHAHCLGEAPEIFGYDDRSNQAFVLNGADIEAHREAVLMAVNGCPETAITLLGDGGSTEG
jgi:ferredoxin